VNHVPRQSKPLSKFNRIESILQPNLNFVSGISYTPDVVAIPTWLGRESRRSYHYTVMNWMKLQSATNVEN